MENLIFEDVDAIHSKLSNYFGMFGFEFYPFKVGWYNSLVQPVFQLDCSEDTLAFLIISVPKMFENCFLPFLHKTKSTIAKNRDLIDECMNFYMSQIKCIFPNTNISIIHDFELHSNRRPKLVFQSAAHASGAAYFYHKKDLEDNSEIYSKGKKMYGVCIHPKYGGWFALRAVAIFRNIECPSLPRTLPHDVVPRQEDRKLLLELYNLHWEDWRFRDIIPAVEKYSDLQMQYFSTPPCDRFKVIDNIFNSVGNF